MTQNKPNLDRAIIWESQLLHGLRIRVEVPSYAARHPTILGHELVSGFQEVEEAIFQWLGSLDQDEKSKM